MDIVERLRGDYGLPIIVETTPICHEAADEIERLRQQVEDLHDLIQRQIYVNSYLRQQVAELVEQIKFTIQDCDAKTNYETIKNELTKILAKATGGE